MIDRRTTVGLLFALILLVTTAFISYYTLVSFRSDVRWVGHTERLLDQLNGIRALMSAAESEVRGYVVTGREAYLELQPDIADTMVFRLAMLDSMMADNPEQLATVAELRDLIQARLELLDETVWTFRNEGADDALAIVRTDRGKTLTSQINDRIDALREEERTILFRRQANSDQRAAETILALLGGSVIVVALVVIILFVLNRQFLARKKAEDQLRQSEARFLQFLELVPAGIFILNRDGTPFFANEMAQQILGKGIVPGLAPDELTSTYKAFRAGTDQIYPSHELPIVRALNGERRTVADIEVEKEGARIPLLITGAPIYGHTGALDFAMAAFIDISTQKEIEDRLAESERRYRMIVDKANDVIYRTDRNGFFTFVNEVGLRLFEYSEREIRTMRFTDLVRPDMREQVRRFYLRQAAERKANTYYEFPAITNAGRQVYLGQNVTLLIEGESIDGFQAVARDITEAREAQTQLQRRENQLSTVIETVDEGITLSDERGVFEIFNPRMEEITGYTKEQANATADFSRLIASDEAEHQAGLDRLKVVLEKGIIREVEATMRSKTGQVKVVLVSTTLLRQGHRNMFLSVYRDITERKEHLEQLEEATRAANAAAKAKAEFLATMSHEIRTPMNGVIGMTDVLLHTDLTSEQHDYVDTIRTSGETLLTIINDILDFSKIESGKLLLDARPFDLVTCIEDVYDLLSFKAKEKDLDLLYLIDPAIPRTIKGDDVRLRQILLNLAGNAVKFTPSGEVFTRVNLEENSEDGLLLRFSVRDTGIGIPEEVQTRLFQAFTQADSSTTRRFGGTGLGLAISQRLVSLMGGEINLSSEVGKGSTFSFTVRLEKTFEQDEAPRRYVRSKAGPLRGRRIVIVDDNETNLSILRLQTERWGMTARTFADPEAAADFLRGTDTVDIGVFDLHMPGLDGIHLAQKVKALPHRSSLPLILLSSKEMSPRDDRERSFSSILLKPVKEMQFLDALSSSLSGSAVVVEKRAFRKQSPFAPGLALHILVAEDNIVNQKLILRMLEKLGCDATLAGTGTEAVAYAARNTYDIILMDVNMPEMDGLEATRRILSAAPPGKAPVILALTAGVLDEDKEQCLTAGMKELLAKPIHMDTLREALERWSQPDQPAGTASPETGQDGESIQHRIAVLVDEIDRPFVRDLLVEFIPETEKKISELQHALKDGRYNIIRETAHSLKGSCANIGAMDLARLFEQLQQCIDDETPGPAAKLLDQVTASWPETKAELSRIASDLS